MQAAPTDYVLPLLQAFFWLVGGIGACLACLLALRKLRESPVAGTPQPFVVSEAAKLVSEEQLNQVHGRISRERAEVDRELLSIRSDQRDLREKLELELKHLNARIDAVPERTIKLLRETKGLI